MFRLFHSSTLLSSSIHFRKLNPAKNGFTFYFVVIQCKMAIYSSQNGAPSHDVMWSEVKWSGVFRWNEWWTDTNDRTKRKKNHSWKVSVDTCLAPCNAYRMQCKRNDNRVALSTVSMSSFITRFLCEISFKKCEKTPVSTAERNTRTLWRNKSKLRKTELCIGKGRWF